MKRSVNRTSTTLMLAVFAATLTACGGGERAIENEAGLSGAVRIDGSSTVFPVTEAVAEEFQIENRAVRVTVGTREPVVASRSSAAAKPISPTPRGRSKKASSRPVEPVVLSLSS